MELQPTHEKKVEDEDLGVLTTGDADHGRGIFQLEKHFKNK